MDAYIDALCAAKYIRDVKANLLRAKLDSRLAKAEARAAQANIKVMRLTADIERYYSDSPR